jgi:endo-1,4-beta-xylanase
LNGHLSLLTTFTLVVVVAASSCGSGRSGAESSACPYRESDCTLRSVADDAGLLVGAAVTAEQVEAGSSTAALVADQFASVTPEYEGTWTAIEAERGTEDFSALDRIVDFATAHEMGVRGHTLVWDREDELPRWVGDIDDPEALHAAVDQHIRSMVGRYAGRIDRWDVVNEPLETTGDELAGDHLLPLLGKDYIADSFRVAHEADPSASLWLNENNVERDDSKADALVELVEELVDDGVPIDGVGVQGHLLSGRPIERGRLAALVRRLRALDVDVAVTELDVPRGRSGSTERQVTAYRRVASECVDAACSEITVWGVDNSHTWLDDELGRDDTDPLLFSADGRQTAAFRALRGGIVAATRP